MKLKPIEKIEKRITITYLKTSIGSCPQFIFLISSRWGRGSGRRGEQTRAIQRNAKGV